MKRDPYKHLQLFENWKEQVKEAGIEGISKINGKLLLNFVLDMESGRNIAKGSVKGARSPARLNVLRIRIHFLMRLLESRGIKDIRKLKSESLHNLFNDMRTGKLRRIDGKDYKSVADYVKVFKAFWHWIQKTERKEGNEIKDITEELDTSYNENSFVYFTKEQLEEMLPYFSQDEQTRLLFMFDSIIRSPTELLNLKVSDLSPDYSEITIREETSKTYGRRIKLLLCKEAIRDYIHRNNLKEEDYLFNFSPGFFNRKLQKVASNIFKEKMTAGGKPYKQLTMYDFRHSGACYWRKGAYRSKIDALMYRGGWTNLNMLNYYTKKLGMKDSIEKEDLLIGLDKTALEKEIEQLKEKNKRWENLFTEFKAEMNSIAKNVDGMKIDITGSKNEHSNI